MIQKHVAFEDDVETTVRRAMPFIPAPVKALVMVATFAFEEFIRLFTRPVEMLLRHQFGVRNLSVYAVVQLLSLAVLGWGIARLSPALAVLLTASGVAAVYHGWEARRATRQTENWRHTRYGGRPLPVWNWLVAALERGGVNVRPWFTPMAVLRFGEPALVLLIGLLACMLDQVCGITLLVSAVALAIKGAITHQRLQDLQFDRLDAQAVSRFLSDQSGRPPATITPVYVARLVPPVRPPEPVVRSDPPTGPRPRRASVTCPHCRASLIVRSSAHSRPAVCPNCEGEFQLPPLPAGEAVPTG